MEVNLERRDHDSPWKQGIEDFFEHFMQFFFPHIEAHIDWSQPPESLEQELLKISADSKMGKLLADKLFKVHMKDGSYVHMFIHIEVQGQQDPDFEMRMFWYNIRIQMKHAHPVLSLAVLTDNNKYWRPDKFRVAAYGWHMEMKFLTAKVLDYRANKEELLKSENPFAMVVYSYLTSLETEGKVDKRYQSRVFLCRQLLKHDWSREKINSMLRFIEWILVLPEELELECSQEFYKEDPMFLCSLERRELEVMEKARHEGLDQGVREGMRQGLEEGREVGRQEGRQEGLQEGLKQGQHKGEAELLLDQIAVKFNSVSTAVRNKVNEADSDKIHTWARQILFANTIDEVFCQEVVS